jgi:hypothetical protein
LLVGIQARLAGFVRVSSWINLAAEFETAGAEHAIGCTTEHTWLSPILVLLCTLISKGCRCNFLWRGSYLYRGYLFLQLGELDLQLRNLLTGLCICIIEPTMSNVFLDVD